MIKETNIDKLAEQLEKEKKDDFNSRLDKIIKEIDEKRKSYWGNSVADIYMGQL